MLNKFPDTGTMSCMLGMWKDHPQMEETLSMCSNISFYAYFCAKRFEGEAIPLFNFILQLPHQHPKFARELITTTYWLYRLGVGNNHFIWSQSDNGGGMSSIEATWVPHSNIEASFTLTMGGSFINFIFLVFFFHLPQSSPRKLCIRQQIHSLDYHLAYHPLSP
jgi:hypothetical protein